MRHPSKKRRGNPQNYSTISLLSVVEEVFESTIAAKMTKFFHTHLLNFLQLDFRQGTSTADLLHSTAWNRSLDCGEDIFVVALDIAAALNRVWHQGMTTKLTRLGVCGDLLYLLKDYLHGRTLPNILSKSQRSSKKCTRAIAMELLL